MLEYKEYLKEIFAEVPSIVGQAKKTYEQQKKVALAQQKKLMKTSTGVLTPARAAAKERLKLIRQMFTKLNDPKTDEDIKAVAGMESYEPKLPEIIEDGEVSMGVPDVTGSAINTTNVGGQFAAKLGEKPNEPGKYKPNSSKIFTRKSLNSKKRKKRKIRKESVEVNNFVDNLF